MSRVVRRVSAGRGAVIWLTGVPATGKTTLARGIVRALRRQGRPVLWLDSDALRHVMTPTPTYTDAERQIFYATIGYLAVLAADGGVTVVISATAMRRADREVVRAQVRDFVEIWLTCAPTRLRERDVKGLYRRADAGEVSALPGEGATYEPPKKPELTIDTGRTSRHAALAEALRYLARRRLSA